MPDLDQWLKLYASDNPVVKLRAARGLLRRSEEVPVAILLEILDELSYEGLAPIVREVLLERRDPALFDEMIARLDSADEFFREVACEVLGRLGNRAAMPHIIRMLDDPNVWVRRAAALALGNLGKKSNIPFLRRTLELRKNDNGNVVWSLKLAIDRLESLDEAGDSEPHFLI